MNAPVDHPNLQVTPPSDGLPPEPLAGSQLNLSAGISAARETAPASDDKICWVELRQVPYLPSQQVELLHLQAEAEALLLQLQAMHQRRNAPSGNAVGDSQA